MSDRVVAMDRPLALRIIDSLQKGSNCLDGTRHFSAGRKILFQAAEDILEELEVSGGSSVRWIKGRYGNGKTHFFARMIEVAHERKWVTSYVQISGPGQGVELHRFEGVYSAIVNNLLCNEMVAEGQGRIEPGRIPGWQWILDRWYVNLRVLAGGSRLGDVPSFRLNDVIMQTITSIRNKWSIHGSFAESLRQYAISRADGDEEWTNVILDWFRGENVHSRGGEIKERLKKGGVLESINRKNSKEMLRSLSVFLRYRNFGGILILLDEVENVLHAPPSSRRTAYTILRELIDNLDGTHGMTRTGFYISGTPDIFESAKGITEYEALAERVLLPPIDGVHNPAGTIIDLSSFPLKTGDFLEMGIKIAHIHGIAKKWMPGIDIAEKIQKLSRDKIAQNPDLSVRSWVREVVVMLENLRSQSIN